MSTTPNVAVTFGAGGQDQVSGAIRQLSQSLRELRDEQKSTSESALSLSKVFQGFIAFEVINRVREFGQEVFANAIAIGKLSQVTGVSAKTLSVMSVAANKLGIDQQALGRAIVFAESNITKLNQGSSQAAKAFGLLGLSAQSFVGLNTDQKILKVVDAVGRMQNGDEKAAAAKALLGKSGAQLIPVLNALAGEGFARVAEEAGKLGLVLNENTVNAALAATVALRGIEETAKGVATQFVGGLLPAIAAAADEISVKLGGEGGHSFEELGIKAGTALKFIVEGLLNTATIGKAAFTSLFDAGRVAFEGIAGVGALSFKAVWDAAHGNFGQIKSDWAAFFNEEKTAAQGVVDAWKGVGTKLAETDRDLFDPARLAAAQKRRLAALQASPTGEGSSSQLHPADDKLAKAQLELLKSETANELSIWKALRSAEDATDHEAYDRGMLSLADYFSRRRATVVAEVSREIAALEAEYHRVQAAPASSPVQQVRKKQELEGIQAKIAVLEVSGGAQQSGLDREEYDQKLALAKQLLAYQQQILTAQGQTFDAAMLGINQEAEDIQRALIKAGLNSEQISAIRNQLVQVKTLAAQFDEERRQGSLAFGDIGLAKGDLDARVASGQVLRVNQERELASIYAAELPRLQQIATTMQEIAAASGNPEQVQAAAQFQQQVAQIGQQADYARQRFISLKNDGVDAFQNDFSNWLSSTDHSLSQLGLSLSRSFQQIIGNLISREVTGKLTSLFHLDQSKGGTSAAGKLGASAGQLTTAGGVIGSSATALASASAQLMAAANTLQSATGGAGINFSGATSGLGGFGGSGGSGGGGGDFSVSSDLGGDTGSGDVVPFFARGGAVRGAGSATSDSIPARLSHGEFVNNAASVSHYGAGLFHALNNRSLKFAAGGLVGPLRFAAGGFVPPPAFSSLPRFASGGFVSEGGRGGGGAQVHEHYHQLSREDAHRTLDNWFQSKMASDWARR